MDVVSAEGDYIGAGKTYRFADVEMTLRMQNNVLHIEAGGWKLEIAPEQGQTLGVGVYRNAKRFPFNDTQPGLTFAGHGRGCNKIAGEFVIWELEVEAGQIVRVALDFVQRCETTMPPLCGMVRFNSVYAP